MSRIIFHRHHLIPRHNGGTNDADNLVKVNIALHAMLHKILWEENHCEEDYLAWRALSGMISKEEIIQERQSLGGKKNIGRKHTIETRNNMSTAAKKRTLTEERLFILRNNARKMSECGHTEETKKRLKEIANDPAIKVKTVRYGKNNGMYGQKHTDESIRMISEKAQNREKKYCFVCDKTIDISNYNRWGHGESCKRGIEE
jgi:hypothetical protein